MTHDDDRFNVLLRRIRALSLEHRSDALVWLSGYKPEVVERALDQINAWNSAVPCQRCSGSFVPNVYGATNTLCPGCASAPCPVCNGTLTIAVAGPDADGQYDTTDCPCQTADQPDPEERWYALHDGWVS